ncbi:phosphatidyl inositol-3-kinase [Encephalitozoon romaleae SJ-2008]|uniref:Phosphatidyl inositol-3-kinase n=1 Tax=Encephalitozoon romaleae (strain SJ-2008) TaxID=1178016 RepID=I7ATQ4_ENCRO|nr:phosphatidyl inositol-3-kinase [Encephalitozoon romaleae SJ-2008]AFN83862.1 phosphatidyl inositol-3-kinase [Encephalitozoon romaleae SJ-2008]
MEEWNSSTFRCMVEEVHISSLGESVSKLLEDSDKDIEKAVAKYLCLQEVDGLYMYFPSFSEVDIEDKLSISHQVSRFWKVRFELREGCARSSHKYEDVVNGFLALDAKYGMLGMLEGQMALIEEIRRIYAITSHKSSKKKRIREYKLYGALRFYSRLGGMVYTSLFNPGTTVKEIVFKEIEIFPSSTFPILVPLDTDRGTSRVMYKKGDDLTKDLFVLETIKYMSRLIGVDLVAYRVIPLSREEGIVEVVDGVDFTKIRKRSDLVRYIEEEKCSDYGRSLEKKKMFVDTLCGYSVACYVMGVGDRNPGNMMVAKDGRFFHIDFSYVFGNEPKPISHRITIVSPIRDYLVNDELAYQDFLSKSGEMFLQIRRSWRKIFVLWCILVRNEIFRLDLDKIISFARDRLKLEITEKEALEHFEKEIKSAVGSFRTSVVHLVNRIGILWRR